MRVLTRRASQQDGFTIVELLLTMTLGLLILGSATLITLGATRHNGEVANRSDATQRGRLAMERMQRDLRSQVCPNQTTLPISAAGRDVITVHTDLSDGTRPITRHTFAFNQNARTLTDTTVQGSGLVNPSFNATPRTTTLATDIERRANGPLFRYWAYPTTVPTSGAVEPTQELVPPATGSMTAANIARIARIEINFLATGATRDTRDIKVAMTNQVFVRTADPNAVIGPANTTRPYDPSC